MRKRGLFRRGVALKRGFRFAVLRCLIACALAMVPACSGEDRPAKVKLTESGPAPAAAPPAEGALRVALGGMITPRAGIAYYLEFIRYIEKRLGSPLRYVDKEDYGEINRMLEAGNVDFAFVCSGPYVDGHEKFGLELLAAPQAYGKTVYYSYVIVPGAGPARSLAELRGKSFACTDPLSNTGNLVPCYMLAQMGETKEKFFSNCSWTHGHDKSIRAVAEGVVDGAAVDSLIWEYMRVTEPEVTSRTRIVATSTAYAIPPVAVRPGLDPKVKESLRRSLLDAHLDADGRRILAGMKIDRFVPIDDAAYDSIREMKTWLARHEPGTR